MPATSIFMSAPSGGISGIGYSRISVLLGPVRTAASTCSIAHPPYTCRKREYYDQSLSLSPLVLGIAARLPLSRVQIDGEARADEAADRTAADDLGGDGAALRPCGREARGSGPDRSTRRRSARRAHHRERARARRERAADTGGARRDL